MKSLLSFVCLLVAMQKIDKSVRFCFRGNKLIITQAARPGFHTNPQSLIELISQRETTHALRGKDILTMPHH